MTSRLEQLYLEGEQAIKNNDFVEAIHKLEEMLAEDPQSCRAHNSLGWLYRTQLDEYDRAETHYTMCLKYAPNYPHAYWNYVYLLTDLERYDEAVQLMRRALNVPSVDKPSVYNRLGMIHELQAQYADAVANYKKAIRLCLNNETIEDYKRHVERCEYKMTL